MSMNEYEEWSGVVCVCVCVCVGGGECGLCSCEELEDKSESVGRCK